MRNKVSLMKVDRKVRQSKRGRREVGQLGGGGKKRKEKGG